MAGVVPIRVAMTGLSKMLTEVLAALLESQDGIDVVASETDSEPAELARRCNADVLVVGGGPELPAAAGALFERIPQVAVLTISPSGREASRFRLVGERVRLLDASPQDIVDTIRDATEHGPFDTWERSG